MSGSGAQLHNVFVYGSFQELEIATIMLHRTPDIISATLSGFKRFKLKRRLYPCIVPSETGEVHGKVLMGLNDDELQNVDAVEGNEYERVTVGIVRKDNSEKMNVETYIWINKDDPDMYGEWDFEEWKRLHMETFVKTIKEIMELKKKYQGQGIDDYTQILHKHLGNTPLS